MVINKYISQHVEIFSNKICYYIFFINIISIKLINLNLKKKELDYRIIKIYLLDQK